jgi:cytochrome P450
MFRQDPAFTPQIVAGFEALIPYVAERIKVKRRNLGNDLLSQLIREQQAGNLSEVELHDYVGMLLIASTDNTANQMALIIAGLLERPEQWGKLVNDPSLIGNAVEEGIRFQSRMVSHSRVVLEEDLKVEGIEIPPGTRVSALLWAAHLTESLFPNPKEFDVTRNVAPGPLTFGGGAYSCLGQHVARIEISEMLTALLTRFPKVRLHGDPQRHHNPFVAWVSDLHVILGPETRAH